jgi:phosphatidate phosphatase APP1
MGSLNQHSRGGQGVNRLAALLPLLWLACLSSAARAESEPEPAVVQIYNGLGTEAGACVWGRVLEDKQQTKPKSRKERWYSKLKRNFDAMESDEIPHAELEIRVLGKRYAAKANDEGLFSVEIPGPLVVGSHSLDAKLKRKGRWRVESARLLIWPKKPGVAVISDIDDTVLDSGVSNKVRLVKKVMMTNAHDLKTFSRAPSLFGVWAARRYPVVFVSGSPVNLYPKLTRFLSLQGFPRAPLLLKDFGLKDLTEQKAYKLGHIAQVVKLLPGYKLILVGDDGEQDPEIYREVERKYPGRVEAAMIHKVAKGDRPRMKGQIVFGDYKELARTLRSRKLLSEDELRRVEKKR